MILPKEFSRRTEADVELDESIQDETGAPLLENDGVALKGEEDSFDVAETKESHPSCECMTCNIV
jgi:hypothetical protein